MPNILKNFLTIDVEEWFQVYAFSDVIHPNEWESYEPRVEKNTYGILDLLEQKEKRATFFVLGWIAEHYPGLVKEIFLRGHEVASHGYSHQCIFHQTPEDFREDIRKAKAILEDIIGEKVIGYRAPSFSITQETLWALPIIIEEGFHYDSSVFPIRHDTYGLSSAPRFPFIWELKHKVPVIKSIEKFERNSSSLVEFPLNTIKFFGYNFAASGGGYFRLYPYFLTKSFTQIINNKEKKSFIFYIHPWELDAQIPRIYGARKLSQFRTYLNIDKTEDRFQKLLSDYQFSSISQFFAKTLASPVPIKN